MSEDAPTVLRREHAELQELFGRVSSPDEDRADVLQELMKRLAAHLDMETQLVLPALRERVEGGAEAADELADEHHRAERTLTVLGRRKVNSPDVPDLVTELLDLTDGHVARAESAWLPALEDALGTDELERMGAEMTSGERRRLSHPHALVPDAGPLAGAGRKVAEVVDRVRDRSTDVNRTDG